VTELPSLAIKSWDGEEIAPLVYGQDYAEYVGDAIQPGTGAGEVVYAASSSSANPYGWDAPSFEGRIVLLDGAVQPISQTPAKGVLVIVPDGTLAQRGLQGGKIGSYQHKGVPYLFISEQTADRILAARGYSLQALRAQRAEGATGGWQIVETGATATVSVPLETRLGVATRHVIGLIPGNDTSLDQEAVFVVSYYDGLGRWPDGALFPGANDNASGVAVMLETARVLKESGFQAKRSVFFVALGTAERRQELDLAKLLSARLGFVEAYKIAAVIEVRGVGAGAGPGLALSQATSGRLADLVREAARREGVPITADRGHAVHEAAIYPQNGRKLSYLALSWEGSNQTEHLTADTAEAIDPEKLARTGRVLSLALMRMAGESKY
jgi:hypothetical protein